MAVPSQAPAPPAKARRSHPCVFQEMQSATCTVSVAAPSPAEICGPIPALKDFLDYRHFSETLSIGGRARFATEASDVPCNAQIGCASFTQCRQPARGASAP